MTSRFKSEDMPKEVKDLYDSFHSMVISCRMIYDSALEEHFTSNQALELAKTFMTAQISVITKNAVTRRTPT